MSALRGKADLIGDPFLTAKRTSAGQFRYLTRYGANAHNSPLIFSNTQLPLKTIRLFARIIKFAQDR
jgi:hypothetical protein